MARVKSKNTRPELRLRRALYASGLRYRLQARELPGRPDIVFRRAKVAVFVHGCFWHQHPGCKHARMPKSRLDFWEAKFAANIKRDERQLSELEAAGWAVVTVWECQTRDDAKLSETVKRIRHLARSR